MVGGAPGMGGGPNLPPTIRETDTQAINEVTKKYVMSMMLDTLKEVIPFTQLEQDEVFQYKAEADRPTLHPLMHLRLSGVEPYVIEEESWQPVYQELFEALPEDIQEWISWEMDLPSADRDPEFVLVNNLLTATAKTLGWISHATQPIQVNSPAEQNYMLNVALPYVALRSVAVETEAILNTAHSWLDSVGANYPHHDSLMNYLTETEEALNTLETLKDLVEGGNTGEEVKQAFVETASEFDRLTTHYNNSSLGSEFLILGSQLDALSTVSGAWALTSGSPSLLLATTMASIGLTSDNEAGFIGNSYNTTINSLLNGILGSVESGPRAELEELNDLYNSLAEFS